MSPRRRFKAGDEFTQAAASKGGKVTAEIRRTQRLERMQKSTLLQRLASLSLVGLMDRLGLSGRSWAAWRVVAKVLDGARLTKNERELFTQLTGRHTVPRTIRELWVIAGRRSGKSRFGALLAVHRATRRYRLAVGETARIMAMAADRDQAAIIHDYVEGFLDADVELRQLVTRRTAEALTLAHNVIVQVATASFRKLRGYTAALALGDETAYWYSEETSQNPDTEILRALRPALATVSGALLVCLTTPHARRGAAWQAYQHHFGNEESSVLVVTGPTVLLNPTIDPEVIAQAEREDPEAARAEWGAQFRRDVEGFLTVEAIDAVTIPGRHELPPRPGVLYHGFTDVSGGTGRDSFTLGISHTDPVSGKAVLDVLRERKVPFAPDHIVAEYADLLRTYHCATVTGDRWAAGFTQERFAAHGIEYVHSTRNKSELYVELLPAVNSGRVELLDHATLRGQLTGLERRTSRGGRDSVDHTPGGKDDVANACAGALVLALPQLFGTGGEGPPWFTDDQLDDLLVPVEGV